VLTPVILPTGRLRLVDETELRGIGGGIEHDRDRLGRRSRRDERRVAPSRDDYRYPATNQVGSQCGQLIVSTFGPVKLNCDVLAVNEATFHETAMECRHYDRLGGDTAKIPDDWHFPLLLRARRERPSRCAAEQRDELAASHSMTSSARASSVGGTSMPRALAVSG